MGRVKIFFSNIYNRRVQSEPPDVVCGFVDVYMNSGLCFQRQRCHDNLSYEVVRVCDVVLAEEAVSMILQYTKA